MKTIIISGATNGIGLEASVALARDGHHVVMLGRDQGRMDAAVSRVKAAAAGARVDAHLGDLASQASIRSLASALLAAYPRIDVLVNNAGAIFPSRTVGPDGMELTFALNHLGPFLLTNLLLERIVNSAPARIVNVSSAAHRRATMDLEDPGFSRGGYGLIGAYGRSKLANVLFTRTLAARLAATGVTVNALHPGGVTTNIWSSSPGWMKPLLPLMKLFMLSPEEGAKTITYLAVSPEVEGKTGLYFEKNRPVEPAPLGRDAGLGDRLWTRSTELVGL